MKLILTRHAQTEDNLASITMGQQDSPLTELGVAGAHALADALKSVPIDAIYSSDLGRCLKTAQIIAEAHNDTLTVLPSPALRELNFGIYTKQPYGTLPPRDASRMNIAFPEGESQEDMLVRVIGAVNELYRNHMGDTVLLVTHFGPLACIFASYERVPLLSKLEQKIDNATIFELEITRPLDMPSLS